MLCNTLKTRTEIYSHLSTEIVTTFAKGAQLLLSLLAFFLCNFDDKDRVSGEEIESCAYHELLIEDEGNYS